MSSCLGCDTRFSAASSTRRPFGTARDGPMLTSRNNVLCKVQVSSAIRSDLFGWPAVSNKTTTTERSASQLGPELPKFSFVFTCCYFHLNHGESPWSDYFWCQFEYLKFQRLPLNHISGIISHYPSQAGMKAAPISHQYLTFKNWLGVFQVDLALKWSTELRNW